MRHGFLPALARELNPRLARALAELADLMREEDTLLDRLASAAARGRTLATPVLTAIEAPLARRAIRLWWRRHGSERRLGRRHVEAVRALATRASGDGEVDVPGGSVVRERGTLRFRAGTPAGDPATSWELSLAPGVEVETPGGWRLALALVASDAVDAPGARTCIVDADRVPGPFVVRNRRPGDRLRIHGLGGHTSLKRLLASRHVPRHLRHDHPVVVTAGEVLWVPGCGRSDRGLVEPATTRCWVIHVIRSPSESA